MRNRIVLFVILALLTLAGTFALWSRERNKSYSMVNVGGSTNQCECTKRLER